MNGSKDIVNFLIQNKINITSKDKQNKTAIEYANENNQEEIVLMLIEMWQKQTKLPLPPKIANIKNRIEEEKRRKQKEEEDKIRRLKELELKEFVDELGLAKSNSNQIFELLLKEHFDVETLLDTPKPDLQLLFKENKIPFGIQAKMFGLIAKKNVGDTKFFRFGIEIK